MTLYEKIIDDISSQQNNDNTYLDENDGLLHCCTCNDAVQTKIELFGNEKIVRCVCSCYQKQEEERKERLRAEERERRRSVCFSGKPQLAGWRFEVDERTNPEISDAMKRYAEQFRDYCSEGRGLLLSGTVGTGKTFFAACIANQLIDNNYRVLFTTFSKIINRIQSTYEGKQEIIDDLNNYDLLILDDLGTEGQTEYRMEMIFNIIDTRYNSGLPFIITTNISLDNFKNPKRLQDERIFDRILQRCFPIAIVGESKRKQSGRQSYFEMKSKLGL